MEIERNPDWNQGSQDLEQNRRENASVDRSNHDYPEKFDKEPITNDEDDADFMTDEADYDDDEIFDEEDSDLEEIDDEDLEDPDTQDDRDEDFDSGETSYNPNKDSNL